MALENVDRQPLIVLNAKARTSQGNLAKVIANRIKKLPWIESPRTFETQHAEAAANIDELAEVIEDGHTIVSLGGDGMAHIVGNAAKISKRRTDVALFPLGGANDTAMPIYGRTILQSDRLERMLRHGQVGKLGGIRVEQYAPGQDANVRFALSYAGIGLSAVAANMINQDDFRDLPPAGETRNYLRRAAVVW
jgi:diacylglycerol kinase family enzyme